MLLSETIKYINTALNYPAISYADIAMFFDMAIAELNTTLHTSIPLVKDLVEDFKQKMSKIEGNKMLISGTSAPETIAVAPEEGTTPECYYSTTDKKYYIYNDITSEYRGGFSTIKGIWFDTHGEQHMYQSYNFGEHAIWTEIPMDPIYECDLKDILPDDWILLWLIPYVCFKYTVRDGGTAQTFAEELSQGFQQLQETYDIPEKVRLATYADKYVYKQDVQDKLPYLNVLVPTKGIFENMKHSRNTNAIYGSFYDRGGF